MPENSRRQSNQGIPPDRNLMKMIKHPPNTLCADCYDKTADHVNLAFRTFVCAGCARAHVEIFQQYNPGLTGSVRLLKNAVFSSEEIARMGHGGAGNEATNGRYLFSFFDSNTDSECRELCPNPTSCLKERKFWIWKKYIKKTWFGNHDEDTRSRMMITKSGRKDSMNYSLPKDENMDQESTENLNINRCNPQSHSDARVDAHIRDSQTTLSKSTHAVRIEKNLQDQRNDICHNNKSLIAYQKYKEPTKRNHNRPAMNLGTEAEVQISNEVMQEHSPKFNPKYRSTSTLDHRTQVPVHDTIRKLQRLPPNKRCADCFAKFPTYVNMTCTSFVCEPCARTHQEMGHEIVQIGTYYFTPQDILRMGHVDAGNEAVNERYLAHFDTSKEKSNILTESSSDSFRKSWLITKYNMKKWYKSPPPQLSMKPSPSRMDCQEDREQRMECHGDTSRRNSRSSNSTPQIRNGQDRQNTKGRKVSRESYKRDISKDYLTRRRSNNTEPPQVVNLPCGSTRSTPLKQISIGGQSRSVSSDPGLMPSNKERTPLHLYASCNNDMGYDCNSTISAEDSSVSTKESSSITSIYRGPSAGRNKGNSPYSRRVTFMRESRQRIFQDNRESPLLPTIESQRCLNFAQLTTPRLPQYASGTRTA